MMFLKGENGKSEKKPSSSRKRQPENERSDYVEQIDMLYANLILALALMQSLPRKKNCL